MARYQASMKMGSLNLLVLVIALSLTVLSVLTLVTAQANMSLADKQAESINDTYAQEIAGQHFLASLDKRLQPSKAAGSIAVGLNSSLKVSVQDFANEACGKASEVYPDVELSSTAQMLTVKELYTKARIALDLRYNLDDDELFQELVSGIASSGSASSGNINGEEIIDDNLSGGMGAGGKTNDDEMAALDDSGKKAVVSTEVYLDDPQNDPDMHELDYYYSLAYVLQDCVSGVSLEINSSRGRTLDALIGITSDGDYVVLSWKSSKIWYADEKKETLWMG